MLTASGQARHHWDGTGATTIIVSAENNLTALTEIQRLALPMFELVTAGERCALRFYGHGRRLQHAMAALVAHGADRKKVLSLRYSIDYGEPFEVHVKPAADATPQPLPLD